MYWIIGVLILIGIIADCAVRFKKSDSEQAEELTEDKDKSTDLSPYNRAYLLTDIIPLE